MSDGLRVDEVILKLLDDGMVRIVVDATHRDCLVPPHLKKEDMLALNLSYRFAGHMMRFGPHSLCVTLSFAKKPFRCEIPYDCVLGVASLAKPPPEPKRKNHLRLVTQ